MVRLWTLMAACGVVLPAAVLSAVITSLPGLEHMPAWRLESGYVTVDEAAGRALFYVFAESQSAKPMNDPLVLQMQGGPGCSSFIGFWMEDGPFQVQGDGTLKANPFPWNLNHNMLWVDSPVGVGFSYSNTSSDYDTDNNKTARDLHVFLSRFLEEVHPELRGNDLWLSSESFGGVYIPTLAYRILFNASVDPQLAKQLQGLVIGNPVFSCASWKERSNDIQVQLFYWHGLVSFRDYTAWQTSGCAAQPNTDACSARLASMTKTIGEFDPDDIYTNPFTGNASLGVGPTPPSSIQENIHTYMNRDDVQMALHVRDPPEEWAACCAEPGQSGKQCKLNYTNHWDSMLPYYRAFFADAPDLSITIYSGDVDIATCPFAYAQLCLSELERPVVQAWRPWVLDGQTAGYVEVSDGFTYATLKGAGHEAPMFQPRAALALLEATTHRQPLPAPHASFTPP